MRIVALEGPAGTVRRIGLAPLTGADEAALEADGGPASAHRLLARLASEADGSRADIDALSVSDADRLLAALYTALYGDRAECRVCCRGCGEDFEFALSLAELIAAQDRERRGPPEADGRWELPGGTRVRAPTLADLQAAGTEGALAARLVEGGAEDATKADAWLERAAPVLALDLDARCPACAAPARIRFDLPAYFAARLAGERPFLLRELHLIAAGYGWSRSDILALERGERRALAALIESERAPSRRAARRA